MTPQWRDQSSLEAYPFRPGSTRRFSFGELRNRDFVDFHAVCRGRVWLSDLEIGSDGFSGRFLSSLGESLSFSGIGLSGGEGALESSLGGVRGVVVMGSEDLLAGMPAGLHRFPDLAVEVLPALMSPPPSGVSSLVFGQDVVFGAVSLAGGAGVAMVASSMAAGTGIRIHVDGDFSSEDCEGGSPIRSINGVTPSASGGIVVAPSSFPVPATDSESRQVFRIHPAPNGIRVSMVDPDV
jgi:hypothetical protein